MLAGISAQYVLFALLTVSGMTHIESGITVETHVFNASVTFLIATAYILFSLVLYVLYDTLTHRYNNRNPDLEIVYDNIKEELKELDPDIEMDDPRPTWDVQSEKQKNYLKQLNATYSASLATYTTPTYSATPMYSATPAAPSVVSRAENEMPASPLSITRERLHEDVRNTLLGNSEAVSQKHEKLQHEKVRPKETSDRQFFLEVYGYGIVIFVVYYSIDMLVLAPALSMLSGLMALSVRDNMLLLRNPSSFPETIAGAKLLTFVSMMLLTIALVEMFVAKSVDSSDNILSEISASSPIYIVLTYVLPMLACLLMSRMSRSCSDSRTVRRAFPLAVLIALFVVFWVLGLDIIVSQRDYYKDAVVQLDSEWHKALEMVDCITFQPNITRRALYNISVFTDPEHFLDEVISPIRRNVPLLSILFEPLVKLALTFSVITAIVNYKATETAAIISFITAIRGAHTSEGVIAYEHFLRSAVVSGCAMLFCFIRYIACVRKYVGKM